MNGHKIKKLIDEYNEAYGEQAYAESMLGKKISRKEKEMYQEEYDNSSDLCYYLANEIKTLNPSKYMISKYQELLDILEEANNN
jgi:hypothetical protein